MYPNPVVDVISINLISKETPSYQLLGIGGRLIREGTLTKEKNTIDFRTLDFATYILMMSTSNGVKTFKIIKN
ncbi:T9SS type A sorting domain-containing protein [Wenyingzhuangia sp. IMCC45533]